MSRVALLIGVSRDPSGLNLLARAQKDVEVMRRVLRQPQFGFDLVEVCVDARAQDMREAIEAFFRDRSASDQVLFLYVGYGIQEGDGTLYFATSETVPDQQGRLIKSRAIPARFMQDAMNTSLAQEQVVILDCHFRQGLGDGLKDARPVDLPAQLGGDGRVILTSATTTQDFAETGDCDTWSYTRYLTEGIETAAADTDSDGVVSAEDLHRYAQRKLEIAAPALHPQLYGSDWVAKRPLVNVSVYDPQVSYRKILEELAEHGARDATATQLLESRSVLDDIKHCLGLSPQEAADMEFRSLQPWRDYRQRLQAYQERFSGTTLGDVEPEQPQSKDWNRIRQALGLTESDTAAIEAAPEIVQQQQQREQYQRSLTKYEQVLLAVMQRQYPLAEGDRRLLQHLQNALQLRDDDTRTVEMELASRLNRRESSSPQTAASLETKPPVELLTNQILPTRSLAPSSVPPAVGQSSGNPPPPNPAPHNATTISPTPEPLNNSPAFSPSANSSSNPPPSPTTTIQPPDASSVNQPVQPPMKTKDLNKTRSYGALIIPLLLLAALGGTLAAIWSSKNLGNPFNSKPPLPAAVNEQGSLPPIKQAAGDINLGVQAYEIGDFDTAVKYYDGAIQLLAGNCQSGGDTTSSQCQVLARAYSNRSHAYFALKNYNQAFNDANLAIGIAPNLSEARINLANARFKRGDLNGAIQDYGQALQLNPNNVLRAGIYNNRGNVWFTQNNFQGAIRDYSEALDLKKNYADAYFNRGLAYERVNDGSRAAADFQNASKYYRDQNNFKLADEAQKKASALQQTPQNTPLPPANSPS